MAKKEDQYFQITGTPLPVQMHLKESIKGHTSVEGYPAEVPEEQLGDLMEGPCEEHLLFQTEWTPNVVCDIAGTLFAALVKGEAGYGGIQYVLAGQGAAGWQDDAIPAASATQTQLAREIGRVAAQVSYRTEVNLPSVAVTNRILVLGVFGPADANGAWREWGIVGGNATTHPNTGILVDYQTHPIITKTNTQRLVRRIRLNF